MAVTKQLVQGAGEEIGDLLVMVVDETPNAQQLGQFLTEGIQAVTALAQVGIPTSQREAVVRNILEGALRRVNEKRDPLPAA